MGLQPEPLKAGIDETELPRDPDFRRGCERWTGARAFATARRQDLPNRLAYPTEAIALEIVLAVNDTFDERDWAPRL